jgi:hypothetical protein
MKIRNGFVSNSSSSSFVIVSANSPKGSTILYEDGDTDMEQCGGFSVKIDEMIQKLQEMKEKGFTTVRFDRGGGYEG